jgi:hypothetical protein
VAAVVKYHSGTKKLEGRILCTQPIKAPGGETKRAFRLMQVTQAYRAVTGDMDQTGPPLRFDGSCDIDVYRNGYASVTIAALRPDVIICVGVNCGVSYTLSWSFWRPESVRQIVPIHVFKAPDAPVSQLLGGGRGAVDIYVVYDYVEYYNRYDLYVYVNGTLVASCYRQVKVSKELRSWTEYKEPNATGVYLFRVVAEHPDGTKKVLDGNLVLYEHNDGNFGFRFILNPIEDPTPQDTEMKSPLAFIFVDENYISYYAAVDPLFVAEEDRLVLTNDEAQVYLGPFIRFWLKVWSPDSEYKSILQKALSQLADIEFNVPYIAVNRTGEYSVYREIYSRQGGSAALRFKTLSISSLGAVYANAVLPIDIKLPPPVLPRNATRTYIFGYR